MQPRAFEFARQGAVELTERLQGRGDGFGLHADAGIGDGDAGAAAGNRRAQPAFWLGKNRRLFPNGLCVRLPGLPETFAKTFPKTIMPALNPLLVLSAALATLPV